MCDVEVQGYGGFRVSRVRASGLSIFCCVVLLGALRYFGHGTSEAYPGWHDSCAMCCC